MLYAYKKNYAIIVANIPAYHKRVPMKNLFAHKPKIAIYGIWPELANYTRTTLQLPAAITDQPLTENNIKKDTEVLGIFVDSKITPTLLKKLPHLRLIVALSTGVDHIDLTACQKHGVTVCNVPTYGEHTVAEHAFALILGLTRKLFPSVKRVKEGLYDYHGLRGTDLFGKTLGIIGTGKIGLALIRMARGFGLNVIAFDPFPNVAAATELSFTYTKLPTLLKTADVVSLHVPLLPTTRHLINKRNIKLMKPGSYLINTARGALIDPEALFLALQSKHLAGAGLDVLEDEEMIQDEEKIFSGACADCDIRTNLMNNLIIDHPNVIVTPHNAFNSTEALERIIVATAENIKNFIAGEPKNVVRQG